MENKVEFFILKPNEAEVFEMCFNLPKTTNFSLLIQNIFYEKN